jgi:YVTN family beta-propeller protein
MLEPDTTYEVRFVDGGLKDVAGNGIDAFSFFFSTGNSLDANEAPQVDSLGYGSDSPVAVGENVTFTASASDAEGDPIEYRWSVDGGANTEWRTGDTFSTSFDTLGQHSVAVQVRDDQGGISSSSRSIVVVESTTASTATGSGPLALDATGRLVWAVNPDNNSVTAIDADTLEKRDEIEVCEDPTGVAVDGSRRVWIACRDADAVQERDSDGSLLDFDYRGVRVAQSIIANSAKVLLAADHTKFGRNAMVRLGNITQADYLFTDQEPPVEIRQLLTEHNVDLRIV